MISLIHSPEQFPDSVGQLSDPYLLRIVSSAEAYGLGTPFLDIWQGNGCCFSRMDGVMTVSGTPLPEFLEETALFLRASGAGQLSCSRETAVQLGFAPDSTGPILCRKQAGGVLPLPPSFPSPRQLYEVLKSCEGEHFPVPEFEAFYLDTSHRLRHGTAAAVLHQIDGQPAACTLALAVTQTAALLTAVAVHPRFRHKGLGSRVVEEICRQLGGRRLFLFRSPEENQSFYEKLGFVPCGEWAQSSLLE